MICVPISMGSSIWRHVGPDGIYEIFVLLGGIVATISTKLLIVPSGMYSLLLKTKKLRKREGLEWFTQFLYGE